MLLKSPVPQFDENPVRFLTVQRSRGDHPKVFWRLLMGEVAIGFGSLGYDSLSSYFFCVFVTILESSYIRINFNQLRDLFQ